jgi:signal transduction histidine kinase
MRSGTVVATASRAVEAIRGVAEAHVDGVVVLTTVLLSGPVLSLLFALHRPDVAAGLAVLPLGSVPLLWRRTHPGPVLVVLAIGFAVASAVSPALPNGLGLVFGGYAAALHGDVAVRRVGGTAAAALLGAAFAAVHGSGDPRALGHLTGVAFGYGVAWVVGDRTRTRRAYLAELEDRALRLERDRDEHVRRAAEEERARIARELHDVVVHNVTVIAVQAGAARTTATGAAPAGVDPGHAVDALGLIERTARATLGEMRALLGVLRHPDGAPPRRPQPTLAQLDDLVDGARRAGLRVTARTDGTERDIGAVVGLSAYRIVQEALTNAAHHAPGADVDVLVTCAADELRVTVSDTGGRSGDGAVPRGPTTTRIGHGLVGMRERAALVGGTVRAGPAAGGFRVEARLPVEPAPAPAGDTADAGTIPGAS